MAQSSFGAIAELLDRYYAPAPLTEEIPGYSIDGTNETETTEEITSYGSSGGGGSGLISADHEQDWAANTSNDEDE